MSKLIDLIIKLATSSSIVSPVLVASINYFILGMGDESFRFDGTLWLPFDTNQPIGFLLASVFQYMSVFAALSFSKSIICIFIGSCWSIVTFLKDIAKDISHLNKKKIANLNKRELTERFWNFIRFHTDVEELARCLDFEEITNYKIGDRILHFRLLGEFNGIYEFIVFSIFLFGLSTVASSLITFQSVE